MVDPTGTAVGISQEYLRESAPFDDFFIPGIVLFTIIGVSSIAAAVYGIMKHPVYPLIVALQGFILVVWIGVQLSMVDTVHILHYVLGASGLVLITIGVLLMANDDKRKVPR